MRNIIVVLLLSLMGVSASEGETSKQPANPERRYTALDDQATQLREDFNRAKGSVRLLFVVDPSCAACLRGMDDVNRDLLKTTSDPRLRTFVVHVPVIGATEKNVLPAAKLLDNEHVHHYWNSTGAFGRLLSDALGLKNGSEAVYAWDVWLVYGPDALWQGAHPPQPQLLMHQLSELEGTKFPVLDSRAFGNHVKRQLAKLNHDVTTK